MTSENIQTRNIPQATVSCSQYSPLLDKKRCRHYQTGGTCSLNGDSQCVEWLRVNAKHTGTLSTPNRQITTDLLGDPLPEPQRPRQRPSAGGITQATGQQSKRGVTQTTVQQSKQRPSAAWSNQVSPNSSIQGLRGLTTEDIESFKKLGAEVCLTTDFGDVWLVPEYTNQTRKEFIPEHMALICHALYAFPGARMVSFEDLPNTETEERQ